MLVSTPTPISQRSLNSAMGKIQQVISTPRRSHAVSRHNVQSERAPLITSPVDDANLSQRRSDAVPFRRSDSVRSLHMTSQQRQSTPLPVQRLLQTPSKKARLTLTPSTSGRAKRTWIDDLIAVSNEPHFDVKAYWRRTPILECYLSLPGITRNHLSPRTQHSRQLSYHHDPDNAHLVVRRAHHPVPSVLRCRLPIPKRDSLRLHCPGRK